jgi:hypothetical protein
MRWKKRMKNTTQNGKIDEEDRFNIKSITNFLHIASTEIEDHFDHNTDHYRSLSAKLPQFKKEESNKTDEFINSLQLDIPTDAVRLVNIHVYGGPECFTKGSLVYMPDGTWKRIEEFGTYHGQILDEDVLYVKDKKEEKTTARMFHIYEERPCCEIITNTGRKVECSYNQQFWTIDEEWKQADQLNVGEKIRTISGYEKIKSIKNIGNKTVYDLTTDAEEFIVNGLKVHNCGKSTLQRAIGYHIKKYFGENCQCLECSYLPDAIHHIDHKKQVLVISVDDPMGAAEEGGTQDARRGSSEDVNYARSTFNAIRHIYKKRILLNRAELYYGKPLEDDIIRAIELYHDNSRKLNELLPSELANVGGIIYMIWGPQLPTIDQTFHQNKVWNIYKGFSAMDAKRKQTLRNALGSFWMHKLGEKERGWRRERNIDAKSWSIIEDPYTNEKGWLYVKPKENVFRKVDRGGKGFQEKIKIDTEKMDVWAQHVYENRDILMPPYNPFDKKENRTRSIANFLKDILKANKDPRTFEDLAPHNQLFLKILLKNKISELDDRIIKFHHLHMDERELVEAIARELVDIIEKEGISIIKLKGSRAIVHDLARSRLPVYKQFVDSPGNFKRIYDHILYLWYVNHPEDYTKKIDGQPSEAKKIPDKIPDEMVNSATVNLPENMIEFNVSEREIVDYIIKENPQYHDRALIYLYSEGIDEYDMLAHRQIYNASQDEGLRKRYGFTEAFTSIEAVKYRKKQFRGMMSYVLGQLFEDWLEKILLEGYEIEGVLEDVSTVQHSNYEDKGKPDFVLKHGDGSYTILAAKCYASTRSETLEKDEIAPEIRYHNQLLEQGKKSRIIVIYTNIEIDHLLIVYVYEKTADIPNNLTFPPSMKSQFFFKK